MRTMNTKPHEVQSGTTQAGLEVDSYSKLEAVGAGRPEDNLPEVVAEPHYAANPQQPKTICGVSRKAFWIALVIVLLIIVGAAVGGGVGATRKSGDSSSSSSSSSSSPSDSSSPNDTDTQAANTFLPNTRLTTFNYTENDVEFSSVFFQSSEASIYHSLWNSSAKTWTVLPAIQNGSEIQVQENTPLTASVLQDDESSTPSFFLFFLDSAGKLRAYTASSLSGSWTADTSVDGEINVPSTSALLTYSKPSDHYTDTQFLVWQQSPSGKLQIKCLSSSCGEQSQAELDDVWPVSNLNSSVAIAPLYSRFNSSSPQLAMYGYSNGLWETHYGNLSGDGWLWNQQQTPSSLNVNDLSKMSANASIAAFTLGWYTTAEGDRTAPQYLHVVWTQPTSKGASVLVNKGEQWEGLDTTAAAAFDDVVGYSSIAANQAGKVYAVEDAGGDVGAQLVEWQFVLSNASYVRVGSVDTTVPQ